MDTERTATFAGQTFPATRKAAQFMSFYSKAGETSEAGFLVVEHNSENAAKKGSWQTAGMRQVWLYRGYAPIV